MVNRVWCVVWYMGALMSFVRAVLVVSAPDVPSRQGVRLSPIEEALQNCC